MEPFTILTAVAAPLIRDNIDTDAIIPSREMKTVAKDGLSDGLFAGWRYLGIGGREPDRGFVLNDPAYAGARILLAGDNFGCGSSREHAVWALAEYGFRAILAPSFSPIFAANCVRNGLAPVVLAAAAVGHIAEQVEAEPQAKQVTVDLVRGVVIAPDGAESRFELEAEAREMLLEGLDGIDLTLKSKDRIAAFRANDRLIRPWIYF